MKKYLYLIGSCLAFNILNAHAVELRGYGEGEFRYFGQTPAYENNSAMVTGGQSDKNRPTFALSPELVHQSEDFKHSFNAELFYRYDPINNNRTHFDVRQLEYIYSQNDYNLRLGVAQEFWGVTESRHLVDIINQIDMLEGVDGEDKLGQPLIQLIKNSDYGNFSLYLMPYFRIQQTQTARGRLRAPLVVNNNNPAFSHSAEELHPDTALRYSQIIDDIDLGLSYFHGTSREATYKPDFTTVLPIAFRPQYDIIDQVGVDLQYTNESMLWKFEGIGRSGQGKAFLASTAGFEYTFYDVNQQDIDIGLLSEYHFDGRTKNIAITPQTIFNNDVFIGSRLALNDTQSTSLLGGAVIDLDTQSTNFIVEGSRRLNDNVLLELELNITQNEDNSDILYFIRKDDFATARVKYYF